MRIHGLGDVGGVAGLFAHMANAVAGDGLSDAVSRKEPGSELIEFPVAPQEWEQIGRKHHQTIAFPLALADLDDHALGVDVRALELAEFGDAEAGGIQRGQDHAMFQVAWSEQQRRDLVATEDDGEGLGLLGVGDILDHPGAVQGGLVEKAERTDCLNERTPGRFLLRNEELLVGADVVRA